MEKLGALVFLAFIAAETADPGIPYFREAVIGVSVSGSLLLLWRFQKSVVNPLTRRADSTDLRLAREIRERSVCEWRLGELARWLRVQGLDVPDAILYARPPWARDVDEGEAEQR